MNNATNATVSIETVQVEGFAEMVIYGAIADVAIIFPIVIYIFYEFQDKFLSNRYNGFERFHEDYINMLAVSYGPLGIMWIMVLVSDGPLARRALAGSVEIAGIGSMCLLWLGLASFMMKCHQYAAFNQSKNYGFAIAYFLLNIGLAVIHFVLAPGIYKWILEQPIAAPIIAFSREVKPDDDELITEETVNAVLNEEIEEADAFIDEAEEVVAEVDVDHHDDVVVEDEIASADFVLNFSDELGF